MRPHKRWHILACVLTMVIAPSMVGCGKEEPPKRPVPQFSNRRQAQANPGGTNAPKGAPAPVVHEEVHYVGDPEKDFEPVLERYKQILTQNIENQNGTGPQRGLRHVINLDAKVDSKLLRKANETGPPKQGAARFRGTLVQPNERDAVLEFDATVLWKVRDGRWDYDRADIKTNFLKTPPFAEAADNARFQEQMSTLVSSILLMSGVSLAKDFEVDRSNQQRNVQ